MRLELTGRHIKITPALRSLVEDGLSSALRKLNSSAVSLQVVLTKEKAGVHAEATLHAKGERFLHGEATGRDARTAIAAVVDKIDRQAFKVKSRWADGKRQRGSVTRGAGRAERAVATAAPAGVDAADNVRIVRTRRYPVKSMTVGEAALEVGEAPNAFFVFRDIRTESLHILFRRPDGNLGLIEPEV
jgi:putative sigma-54 modulation protein